MPDAKLAAMNRFEFLQILFGGAALPGINTIPDPGRGPNDDPGHAEEPAWLADWNRHPVFPVTDSDDPVLARLAHDVRRENRIDFRYHGGSRPGRSRTATPILLFVRPRWSDIEKWLIEQYEYRVFEGKGRYIEIDPVDPFGPAPFSIEELADRAASRYPAHLLAWCHENEAKRCFRVDRMEIQEVAGIMEDGACHAIGHPDMLTGNRDWLSLAGK